ncbi:site-specific integrase [Elizabethkingia anophelis]|uniref:site-specific integrase n=1 Tax=Elizabethkingia anophelis TaxID=1117645 RepID=UPI003892A249
MDKTRYIIRFNRKNRTDKQGLAPIQIECYLKGKRKFFDTKIKAKPQDWNEKRKELTANHPNATKLNKRISEIIRDLENYELDRLNTGKSFSLNMLENVFKNNSFNTFNDFMLLEIENSNLNQRTKLAHLTTLHRLNNFKKTIHFTDITFEFLHDFERYCKRLTIKEKGKSPRKLAHNTIWKYFKNLKTYVNLAINKELMTVDQYPFRKFKFTQKETDKTYLLPHEIELIENLKVEDAHLKYIHDLFLFAVYTGLRYSDVMSLEKTNIVFIDNKSWIIKTMEKTDEKIRIPIHTLFNGKPMDLIRKYWDLGRTECFPYLTNQYVNRGLKVIIKKAGISKPVSFHTARHTTATYLLYKGANMTTVQKILGHKKITTTQIYGHIMDMTIENDLKAINF